MSPCYSELHGDLTRFIAPINIAHGADAGADAN